MQQRRGTASAWTSANTVLTAGEIGVETDTGQFKIGDGTTTWNSLPYFKDTIDLDIAGKAPINNPTFTGTVVLPSTTSIGNVSSSEILKLDGLTPTTAELNKLSGVTASTNEINYLTGVTSAVQTQLDAKAALTGNQTLTGTQTLVSGSTTTQGLIVRGLASQTAALQSWQNSAGANIANMSTSAILSLAGISASGNIVSSGGGIGGAWSIYTTGANTNGNQFGKYSGQLVIGNQTSAPTAILKIPASGVQNPFSILNASDAPVFQISPAGRIYNENPTIVPLRVIATSTSSVAIASISGSGTVVTYTVAANANPFVVGQTVTITGASTTAYNLTNATITGVTSTTFTVASSATGATSTATAVSTSTQGNLQEWQNAAGTALASVSSAGAITAAGGTMTAPLTLSGAPSADLHAATKAYVDNVVSGLNFHSPVRAATTANITLSGTQTVDGVALVAGDRVLVKNQTNQTENGIYVVSSSGWTRATDADNNPTGEIAGGDFVFVLNGTVNAGFGYVCSNTTAITIGVTNVTYVPFNAGQTVTAGTGLTESTPGTLAVDSSVVQYRVTGVSDTEIGYLDGVTSAIQTQLDAKVAKSEYSAKGTILVGTGNGTYTAQTVGTNGQVLSANSAQADGVEWITFNATPAFDDLTDVTLTSSTANDVVYYNGTTWVNRYVAAIPTLTNAQTGTTYTLVSADAGKIVEVSNASAITVTIPTNASVPYAIGTQITILQTGAGQITIADPSGGTLNATPGKKLRAQWSSATLLKRGTDTWVLMGDLTA